MNEETLFHDAQALPVGRRAAFLEQACASDAALRGRVESLLHALDNPGTFMQAPIGDPGETLDHKARQQLGELLASPASVPVGRMIGPYKLLQLIGEGGFGTVYMAEQETPVKRRVALKIIKAGMDTRQVIARFEAERQALAMMDHPNIARVLEAGATDDGRPYFVMELVKGIPITDYCDQARLNTRQRLGLFLDVCSAIRHAHQKGVIHRDLKPSNIMITLRDDKPNVKVIDFGIAKATDQKLTEKTVFTAYGQMIGTPAYMSPEQAAMSEFDVDTRSDVYSLGVLLYELLIGSPPFDARTLRSAGFDEMRRIIREQQPQKPSTKLTALDKDSKLTVAGQRQVSLAELSKQLHGDLDWIVLKALEKDRARRYESASAFAEDIQRHLNAEPVLAAAPTAGYVLRKFIRRNKRPLTVAAAVALLLLSGTAVSTWQAIRATRAKALAIAAVSEKAKALAAANAANEQAQKRLRQIEKANDILGSVFKSLDPKEIATADRPLQAILVEKLDKAVDQLQGDAIGDPVVVAAMQNNLGKSLLGLGEPEKAIVLLKQAVATQTAKLGRDHPDTLASMNDLAVAYSHAGKWDHVVPVYEELVNTMRVKLGADHPDTLTTMTNLANVYLQTGKLDQALPLAQEALKLTQAKFGPFHSHTLRCINVVAATYLYTGRPDFALPLCEQTVRIQRASLGPGDPDTQESMELLSEACLQAGKPDKSLSLAEEVFKLRSDSLGPDHPRTLEAMGILGAVYTAAGNLELAVPLLEKTVKLMESKLLPDHPSTIISRNSLVVAYIQAGKLDKALPLSQKAVSIANAKLGPDHPDTLSSVENLGRTYELAGNWDKALPLLEQTLKLRQIKLGPDHPDTIRTMYGLARAYQEEGKPDKDLPLFEHALKLMKARLGPDSPETLGCMNDLAGAYLQAGMTDQALPLAQEALQRTRSSLGEDTLPTARCMSTLSWAYYVVGNVDQALPLCDQALKGVESKLGPKNRETLRCMNNLALAYLADQKPEKALALAKEALELTTDSYGPDHPDTLTSMGVLAETYAVSGQPDKALPLFERTLNLMKVKLGPDHPTTLLNMERLAEEYWHEKRFDKSIAMDLEILQRSEALFGRQHPQTIKAILSLGMSYKDAGQLEKALPLLEESRRGTRKDLARRGAFGYALFEAYVAAEKNQQAHILVMEMLDDLRAMPPRDVKELTAHMARLGSCLLQIKAFADAQACMSECLDIRNKTQPEDWSTFNTQSMLGGALLGQKKYDQAEPLLLQGYQGMDQREKMIPALAKARLTEALDRLVSLYESRGGAGDAEKAARYRERLDQRKAPEKTTQPSSK